MPQSADCPSSSSYELDEEKNGYVARDYYYMPYSYLLDSYQDYRIMHQGEVTWEQGPIRALASITLQRNLISTTSCGAQPTNFGLLVDTG